jgi:hypothetical protein
MDQKPQQQPPQPKPLSPRYEAMVQCMLKENPKLTREKILEEAEAHGFDLTKEK